MFYSPKHVAVTTASTTRRRIAGVAIAGATVAGGSIATASSASATTSGNVWDAVAACESGGNWSINTGNGFYGGLQFTSSTWSAFGGDQFAPEANQASKSQQIQIAQNVLQTQGPGAWPVCSAKAGLTSANGMTGGSSAPAPAPEPAPQQQTQERSADQGASRSADRASTDQGATDQGAADQGASGSTGQSSPGLAVDGIFGPNSKAAVEKWIDGTVNSDLSAEDIKALQAEVGTVQDGIVGPITTGALQEMVGAAQDGIWGPKTTAALQQYLNSNVL